MPEITLLLLGLLLVMFGLGFVLGWILRGGRIRREKAAINLSWQDQMSAKKIEHERLAEQNKSLMEQTSQYQASKKDAELRAKELTASLKETFDIRDELRGKLKEARNVLDLTVAERDKIKTELDTRVVQSDAHAKALKDKDQKIFNLSRELESWQNRLPPLMERFRLRDLEAQEMEVELKKAKEQLASLKNGAYADHTHIEPMETSPLAGGLDASNDQYDETSEHEAVDAKNDALPVTAIEQDPAEDDESGHNASASIGERPLDDEDGSDDAEHLGEALGAFDKQFDDQPTALDYATDDAPDDAPDDDHRHSDTNNAFDDPPTDDKAGYVEQSLSDSGSLAAPLDDAAAEDTHRDEIGAMIEDEHGDNLQQIKGVGPSIEKTLHGLGIYRFEQIAEMSEYDIDRVARELRGFRSRIYREDWIGQAKLLQAEKPEPLA